MSITNDIRSYADTALEQGKQFTDTAKDNVSGFTSMATGAVLDLRTQAEKTINIDAIKSAVEPYLAQAKQYRSAVTDRAEGLFESVKTDKRVAKVITTAESLTGVVVETVQERVVAPVLSLTGRGAKPAPKRKPAATATSKPAATRPAKKAPAETLAAKTTARKTTARKSTARKSTATKSTARKAPAKKAAQS